MTHAHTTNTQETEMAIPENLQKWLKAVAPYVKAHLQAGLSEEDAIREGMSEYKELLSEMYKGKSGRAKLAQQYLQYHVHTDINRHDTVAFLQKLRVGE